MSSTISKEMRLEILEKVKKGHSVLKLANQYAISDKTIYRWLQNQTQPHISPLKFHKLKKENEELKRILGMVMLELERKKRSK